jgi:hypothetical protein
MPPQLQGLVVEVRAQPRVFLQETLQGVCQRGGDERKLPPSSRAIGQ